MLSLFASQNTSKAEFEVFGYGFKNLGYYKELLLFLAAVISPISAVLTSYQKYINALTKECIKKLTPNENVRKFYSYKYIDNYLDWLISAKDNSSNTRHGFSLFILFSFGLILLFLIFTLLAGSFFIQINVIYDVVKNPSSSYYINLFVITFAIASMLFSWLLSIIQLPMPEIDNSNYARLSKIEDEDPEKYQEILKKLSVASSKKDARSLIIMCIIIYTVTFSAIAMYWYPSSLTDITYFLGKAMPGTFIVMISAHITLRYIKQLGITWLLNKYPDGSEERLDIFIKMQKLFLFIKIIIPFFISTGYAFYALSHN